MLRCNACGSNCCRAICITGIVVSMYHMQPEIRSQMTWANNGHANCCWSGCAACLDVHIACSVIDSACSASSAGRVLMFVHNVRATWLACSTKRTSSQDHVDFFQKRLHLPPLALRVLAVALVGFFWTNAGVNSNYSALDTHAHLLLRPRAKPRRRQRLRRWPCRPQSEGQAQYQ